jgi:cysteinyl-tRNA synthetase
VLLLINNGADVNATDSLGRTVLMYVSAGVIIYPPELVKLADERLEYKKGKNFTKADEIRRLLTEKFPEYIVQDTPEGYAIKHK